MTRRWGLVGGVSLGVGWALRFKSPHQAQCLSPCCLQIRMLIMDSPSDTVSKPQLFVFFCCVALVMVSLHSNRMLTRTGACSMPGIALNVRVLPAVRLFFPPLSLKALLTLLCQAGPSYSSLLERPPRPLPYTGAPLCSLASAESQSSHS